MNATKKQLIDFLEDRVLKPAHEHAQSTETIRKKVIGTRWRLKGLETPEAVEQFFWSAMATNRGIDSYTRIRAIGASTFEDVRAEFKTLCGRA